MIRYSRLGDIQVCKFLGQKRLCLFCLFPSLIINSGFNLRCRVVGGTTSRPSEFFISESFG
jgi:hypothetical protein